MEIVSSYGQIRSVFGDGIADGPLPVTAPLDDLLGLVRAGNDRDPYLDFLRSRYGSQAVAQLEHEGVRAVRRAAEAAARGVVKRQLHLRPLLQRRLPLVSFGIGHGPSEVPDHDLLALTAYSTVVTLWSGRDFALEDCRRCLAPWLAPIDGPHYCLRPAPGGLARSCREVNKEQQLLRRDDYGPYRRQYKRISELLRRGSISRTEAERWRSENTPEAWLSLEEWRSKEAEPDG